MVEQHVAALSRFLDLEQTITLRDKVLTNAQAHSVMIAGLLTRKGSRLDAATSEGLTEDYLDAIEDLPAWCVREAIRKWNRGESAPLDKKPHDFNWRPEPGTLARLARLERAGIALRILNLQRITKAEPEQEFTEQQARDMREKMREVSPILRAIVGPEKQPAEVAAE